MRGKLIVIEGTDCSGKETQTKLLIKKLREDGIKVDNFSFPNYNSPTGKIIGNCYLGKNKEPYFKEGSNNVDPYVSSLYYAADRKYNMDKEILEYYNKGYYVILDRYTSSNQAHQGSKIKDKDERFNMYQWIDKLEYWLLKLPKPDITIYLHVPYENTIELLKIRGNLDDNEKDKEFLRNSEEAYIELFELYGWKRIECVENKKIKTREEIHKEIINIVLEKKDER